MDPSNSTYLTQDQIDAEFELQAKEMILASAFDPTPSIQPNCNINASLDLLYDYLCCISNYADEDRARASFEANIPRLDYAWQQLRDKLNKEYHDIQLELQDCGRSGFNFNARTRAYLHMKERMSLVRAISNYLSERFLNVRVEDTSELP